MNASVMMIEENRVPNMQGLDGRHPTCEVEIDYSFDGRLLMAVKKTSNREISTHPFFDSQNPKATVLVQTASTYAEIFHVIGESLLPLLCPLNYYDAVLTQDRRYLIVEGPGRYFRYTKDMIGNADAFLAELKLSRESTESFPQTFVKTPLVQLGLDTHEGVNRLIFYGPYDVSNAIVEARVRLPLADGSRFEEGRNELELKLAGEFDDFYTQQLLWDSL